MKSNLVASIENKIHYQDFLYQEGTAGDAPHHDFVPLHQNLVPPKKFQRTRGKQ